MVITEVIFCDDVRREIGNKLSLMGIYDDRVKITIPQTAELPISFRAFIYARFLTEMADAVPSAVETEIWFGEDRIFTAVSSLAKRTHNERPFAIVVNLLEIPIFQNSELVVKFKVKGPEQQEIPLSVNSRTEARLKIEVVRSD